MFAGRNSRNTKRVRPVAKDCPFCKTDTVPSYQEIGMLNKYLTERGKILAQTKTGICSKHQRMVTRAIKRARHLATLPFVVRA